VYAPRNNYNYGPRYNGVVRYYGPRFDYVPRVRYHYQPYYSFRPRLSLGFGLFIGYPVAFPSWYDPYAYSGYSYGYGARPAAYGGVSFDIDPYDAEIYVDGEFVGIADDFASTEPPLTLTAGMHRIELRAPGFRPVTFDITAIAGQVIPYQGSLGR
jgi:hypothetical protein